MQQWKLSPPFFVLVLLVRQIRANCYHYHHHHYCLPSHHLFTLNLFVIQEVSLLAILNYKWYLNDSTFIMWGHQVVRYISLDLLTT